VGVAQHHPVRLPAAQHHQLAHLRVEVEFYGLPLYLPNQVGIAVPLFLDLDLSDASCAAQVDLGVHSSVKRGGAPRSVSAILAGVMNE
jgi:hypothetical protein